MNYTLLSPIITNYNIDMAKTTHPLKLKTFNWYYPSWNVSFDLMPLSVSVHWEFILNVIPEGSLVTTSLPSIRLMQNLHGEIGLHYFPTNHQYQLSCKKRITDI